MQLRWTLLFGRTLSWLYSRRGGKFTLGKPNVSLSCKLLSPDAATQPYCYLTTSCKQQYNCFWCETSPVQNSTESFWELASALAWAEEHNLACKFSSLIQQFCSVAVSARQSLHLTLFILFSEWVTAFHTIVNQTLLGNKIKMFTVHWVLYKKCILFCKSSAIAIFPPPTPLKQGTRKLAISLH